MSNFTIYILKARCDSDDREYRCFEYKVIGKSISITSQTVYGSELDAIVAAMAIVAIMQEEVVEIKFDYDNRAYEFIFDSKLLDELAKESKRLQETEKLKNLKNQFEEHLKNQFEEYLKSQFDKEFMEKMQLFWKEWTEQLKKKSKKKERIISTVGKKTH